RHRLLGAERGVKSVRTKVNAAPEKRQTCYGSNRREQVVALACVLFTETTCFSRRWARLAGEIGEATVFSTDRIDFRPSESRSAGCWLRQPGARNQKESCPPSRASKRRCQGPTIASCYRRFAP